ncbi:GDP-fucose protein O-fucosyltransferase [Ruminiclostridium sufflavum DSM 19573]|uniref:GDP-fucose protein O-fucosyltransferase n=1 Tax=Ruminiclostridium sufflavum DSM 19573 TaxID=1121337 RepID=A0A318XIC2_9FIRM|nr:hypothetical protein [Ruminiclostridium sufflavum]PYG84995.1 GDP-fucose protein O-fucosyltransferase [Ruminiclostridium sufflavum DSM 19573]
MSTNRFLLIKALGKSIWTDVDHVMCQLFAAELTERIPIVYWGMESIYSISMDTNAYEFFFEPVSQYTVHDLTRKEYTFYPPVWKAENLLAEDTDRLKMENRDLNSLMKSEASVVVSDVFYPLRALIPWIKKGHWAYGKTPYQIYRQLFDKYLKLQPEVKKEIHKFVNTHPNFRDEKPIIGVHVRGNAIANEVAQIYNLNEFYKPNIWQFVVRYNARHLFLITDSAKVLRQYKRLYGMQGLLINSDSKKMPFKERIATCLIDYPNKRHKGVELIKDTIEIIKDTYLAVQCDFFIGNGYSSLSNTVMRLRDWPETNIKLLY